ncbi:MAG: UPF0182 family protein [Alphaproteobacteria bacterium]
MPSRVLLWGTVALVVLVAYTANSIVALVVDYHWFGTVGFSQVFRTILLSKIVIAACGIAIAFVILYANFLYAVRQLGDPRRYVGPQVMASPLGSVISERTVGWLAAIASLVLAVLTGITLASNWETVLLYLNGVSFDYQDAIFARDAGFYVFSLPFYDMVRSFLWSTGLITLIGTGLIYYVHFQSMGRQPSLTDLSALAAAPTPHRLHIAVIGAFLLALIAVGAYLKRYELMYQPGGLFTGPGYAEVHATLPVLALQVIVALIAAVGLVAAVATRRWRVLPGVAVVMAVVWIGGALYGGLLQRFVVSPNELERERPYLADHIAATNRAYALDQIVERHLAEDERLTLADIQRNQATVNNVRLWDHGPLLDTFAQIQEIRTYYDFVTVDNDRYRLDGEMRQTMLSPRELNTESLPSRTWVNERLTFTHGYGLTVGPVNRVNEQGLPVLYVKDLPPRSSVPELDVPRPEIYYGELTRDYVFVKTRQQEFNYPEGDQNIFSTYEGSGGVGLGTLWRRLLFAAFTGDMKMLLSDDFSDETRILVYRNIGERIRKVAPFLRFDRDPYMVIDEGRLYWIFDTYTISDRFPYSEHIGRVANYMRNPVKVVMDAYNGSMTFYMVDPEEPIARAWDIVFPGMIRPMDEMSPSLRAHLRHPLDYFSVQAEMYAVYHMLDVNTFYNKEDQWSVPKVGDVPMEPYYTVMRLPEEQKAEFILMLPFTPRLKDNLAAWMVARNDGENLGQLVVYTFPKQRLIYGPKQMVGRINQDPFVSQQITLWDRAGSNVIRGTLLVIPIEQSLIYIQPLYLRSEDGRIPELKRVIVGYGNDIAMGVNLEDALERIFGAAPKMAPAPIPGSSIPIQPTGAEPGALERTEAPPDTPAARARHHYDAMRDAAGAGDWSRFGRELDELGKALEEIQR